MTSAVFADGSPARSNIVFVLGMGRSGSSALTRVLSLCGAVLPADLLGGDEDNLLGHWEPRGALEVNEGFLCRYGSTWHDPTLHLQGEVEFGNELRAAYIEQIQAFLRALPAARLLVVKEPRITALSGFWFEAASRLGLAIRVVIAVRHPEEVIASLAARDQACPELSSALWLKYNLLAERESRACPRVFVEYANLLRDWRREMARIGTALSLDLSAREEGAIDEFLRQDLRRQRREGAISEPFGLQWVSRTYAALSAASRDDSLDTNQLDEIFDAYKASERTFRLAVDEFRSRVDFRARLAARARGEAPSPARRPNIAKLIHAIAGPGSMVLAACLNSRWYREGNPDVFAAQLDPYDHWLARGADEGRLPTEDPLSLLERLLDERASRSGAPNKTAAAG
jgi:hypothetical protein